MISEVCFSFSGLTEKEADIIKTVAVRRLSERAGVTEAPNGYFLSFRLEGQEEKEYYSLEQGLQGSVISGNSLSAIITGFGTFLRESELYPGRGMVCGCKSIRHFFPSVFRGMYFATHNNNFYVEAPMQEIRVVMEDLMLWGMNALCIWFDLHHYTSINEEAAVKMLCRIREIFEAAHELGIKTVVTANANEAFPDSPEDLRAQWKTQGKYHRELAGHYHIEICPSKQGGIERILHDRAIHLEAIKDLHIDYIVFGPYDQGGCTCEACAPWGANGYLRCLKALRPLVRQYLPDTTICLSSWYFERFISDEWAAFIREIEAGDWKDWIGFIIAHFHEGECIPAYLREHKSVGSIPLVEFSEISMYGAKPWGGFGANPYPKKLNMVRALSDGIYSGCLPYSEGIYEDINKAIILGQYSGISEDAFELVRLYAKMEFSEELADDIAKLVSYEEETLLRTRVNDELIRPDRSCPVRFPIHFTQMIHQTAALAEQVNSHLDERTQASWKWRILYLRALIDRDMYQNNWYISDQCVKYMNELVEIYHGQKANYWVSPPTPDALVRNGVLNKDDVNG